MGLVGWSDALNAERDRVLTSENDTGVISTETASDSNKETYKDDGVFSNNDEDALEQYEEDENIVQSGVVDSDGVSGVAIAETESDSASSRPSSDLQSELLEVISQLKLRQDESTSVYDISKIELHEVKFIFDHVLRNEKMDFYKIVRATHEVRHRLLEAEILPDSISSPNLDDLIDYIEIYYQKSVSEE